MSLFRTSKVADDFYVFSSGNGTYEAMLDCFEKARIELRSEIDTYYFQFANEQSK